MTPARSPMLVIEADAGLGGGIVEQLIADNHPAKLVQNARHAALFAERYPPSLVIIGEFDSPRAPLGLLRHIRRSDPDHARWQADVPVIMLSSSTHQADLLRAFDAGADDILTRPPAYLDCELACEPSCAGPRPAAQRTVCCASARWRSTPPRARSRSTAGPLICGAWSTTCSPTSPATRGGCSTSRSF